MKRIKWVDAVRGLCIFCVMLSHTDRGELSVFPIFFRPFFLTLFFLISGILYKNYKIEKSIIRSLKGIMVPMLIFSTLRLLINKSFYMEILNEGFFNALIKNFVVIVKGDIFWFLSCLFVVQTLFSILTILVLNRIGINLKLLINSILYLSIFLINREQPGHLLWNIDTSIYAMAYFMTGYLIKENLDYIPYGTSRTRILSAIVLIFYTILVYYVDWNSIGLSYDMHNSSFGNPLAAVSLSLFASLSILYFCMNYSLGSFVEKLGMASLVGYCCQGIAFAIVRSVFSVLHINNNYLPNFYYFVFCTFSSVIIWYTYKALINYLPFTLGKFEFKQRKND